MLISPLVPKGAIFQHPMCSAKFKANGLCTDGGRSRGSDQGGAQFEHSSLPATIKSLFNLTDFLTRRDAWAGDLSELLTEHLPRTGTPMHLPEAHAPQSPWIPAGGMPPEPPPPPPPTGPPWCGNSSSPGLPCTLFAREKMCQDTGMLGSGGTARGTIAECLQWCAADPACKYFSVTGKCEHLWQPPCGWCVRYKACTPRNTSDLEYNTYEMGNVTDLVDSRRLLAANEAALQHEPRHCSAGDGCPEPGSINNKQQNHMRVLSALTGATPPDGAADSAAATAWILQRWAEYVEQDVTITL
jgi:hypothetical protein